MRGLRVRRIQLEGSPEEIALGTDAPHTVYLRGEGQKPQMVVMEPREVDGKTVLTNADLCRQVTFTEMRPELVVEIEEEEDDPPPVSEGADPAPKPPPAETPAPAPTSVAPAAGS